MAFLKWCITYSKCKLVKSQPTSTSMYNYCQLYTLAFCTDKEVDQIVQVISQNRAMRWCNFANSIRVGVIINWWFWRFSCESVHTLIKSQSAAHLHARNHCIGSENSITNCALHRLYKSWEFYAYIKCVEHPHEIAFGNSHIVLFHIHSYQ